MANFSYIVDASFQPFSMQEMLVPFTAYKEAFEKSEENYNDLSDKSDKFKYLSETLPEGSKARAIYEGYANDLKTQAEDLAHNGLTMSNRRALTSLKRRYQGEIGRLTKADEDLQVEKKLRQSLNAQDPERLYATDNLNIDDFLDGNNPNLYSISGKDLYARGAQAAKAYSSRVFNTSEGPKTLGGYYIDWIQRNGTSNESIAAFMQNMQSIPEMYNAFNSIMKATGVTKNLSGYSLERAKEEVLNGMVDGFVYQEQHSPQRDLGVMSATEKAGNALAMYNAGVKYDSKGNMVADEDNINYQDKDLERKIKQAGFDTTYQYNNNTDSYEYNPTYIQNARALKGKGGTVTTDSNGNPVYIDEKDSNEEGNLRGALGSLGKKELANNSGFNAKTSKRNYHYSYAGALAKHGNTWYSGKLGDDDPGHNGLLSYGWASSSNVEDIWGNFSAEGSDSDKMSVLSVMDTENLLKDPQISEHVANLIYDRLSSAQIENAKDKLEKINEKASKDKKLPVNKATIVATVSPEFEIIAVPGETFSDGPNYLVATLDE